MTVPGPRAHELVQALDLARRKANLDTNDLAEALFLSARTIRRYLRAERRPERDVVVGWEGACGIADGRLTAIYDAPHGGLPVQAPPRTSAEDHQLGDNAASTSRRPSQRLLTATTAVLAGLIVVVVLLTRAGAGPGVGVAAQDSQHPVSVARHRFTTSYTGDVWIRVTSAAAHAGEVHRVSLHWGGLDQSVVLHGLSGSQAVFFGKNKHDSVPLVVRVRPAARIAFGEDDVPARAKDVKDGWAASE